MTTRQTIESTNEDHIPSGYEGNNIPEDIYIPSCGIGDIDEAIFNLFDKEIGFQVQVKNIQTGTTTREKPFVLFASGERFALAKKTSPIRDKNKSLILPSISIIRKNIEQTTEDSSGRGINQNTGDWIIKRRLDSSDKDYQALINKLAFKNINSLPSTRRTTGELGPNKNAGTKEGGLLQSHFNNNIFEIITIPQPQFVSVNYEVIFWTNYNLQMNYMIETLFSSFLPQGGKALKLNTDKGYWFIGYAEDTFNSQDNIDDFTEQDRIIKYNFNIKVKSFFIVPDGPGNKVGLRRYLSATNLVFDTYAINGNIVEAEPKDPVLRNDLTDRFILTDIEQPDSEKQQKTSLEKLKVEKTITNNKTGKSETITVNILQGNQKTGESVYYTSKPLDFDELMQIIK